MNDETIEEAASAGEPTATDAKIAELEKQVAEFKDKYLRSVAEYQTSSRRWQQNVFDARDQQTFEIAKALVKVLDTFDHALAVDPVKVSSESVLTGVGMVRTELLKSLESFGIARIEARPGDEFDPRRHEALMRQPTAEIAEHHVVAQLQPGYTLGERTVRPVKVSVASPPAGE